MNRSSIQPIHWLACTIISAALGVIWCIGRWQRSWKKETYEQVEALIQKKEEAQKPHDTTHDFLPTLPSCVKRYLQQVLPKTNMQLLIRSLVMEQEGTFLLNGKWIPFTAVQVFSANKQNPGFVWDANMELSLPFTLSSMPIHVRDSYVDGKGTMVAKLLGLFPMVYVHDTPDLNHGELIRWLAECCLFPTTLSPGDGLEWTSMESLPDTENKSRAKAHLKNSKFGTNVEMEFRFNQQDMIESIFAIRPALVGDRLEMLPWEGQLSEYESHDDLLIPTKMEVGWWKNGQLELYFKCHNTKFRFEFNV
eukprot:scaffold159691_cov43-Attheya_sp.AAC.1